jgi:hypothetical protein
MLFTLARRGDYRLGGAAASRITRIGFAALVMGAAMFTAQYAYAHGLLDGPFTAISLDVAGHHIAGAKELQLAITCVAAVLVYAVLLFAFGGLKLSELKRAMRRGGRPAGESAGEAPAGPDLL